MTKNILVATDDSAGARRAVDYAAALAKLLGANLLIVNVVGSYSLSGQAVRRFTRAQTTWLKETLEALSAELLRKALDRAKGVGPSKVQIESRMGDVAPTIIEIADERDADIMVVGKRGQSRVKGILLGSVSQKLVSLASRPVIVVP